MLNDVDQLIAAARRRTGLSDLGDEGELAGLGVLLRSLAQDTRLSLAGRISFRQFFVGILANRLMLTETRRARPELLAAPLNSPIVVTGLPRSGTTLVHRMLAADPDNHAPPTWESMHPFPPSGRFDSRRLRARLGMSARMVLVRDMDRIHYTAVDEPEEDLVLLATTFESWLFWAAAPVDAYNDWYFVQERAAKYREYRAWLQVYQSAHPGKRLVVKAPEHIGAFTALRAAIPEANIVQLHRNPVEVFPSHVSLVRATHRVSVKDTDPVRVGRGTFRLLTTETDRNLKERDGHPVVDVRYDDLVADPRAEAARIYRECGLAQTDTARAATDRYVRENPQGKRGVHRYSMSDTGLSEDEVRDGFAAYNARFGF